MVVGFVIWSLAALIFLGIGISCSRSKEAVGFSCIYFYCICGNDVSHWDDGWLL